MWDQCHMQVMPKDWTGAEGGNDLTFPALCTVAAGQARAGIQRGELCSHGCIHSARRHLYLLIATQQHLAIFSSMHVLSQQSLSLTQFSDLHQVRALLCSHLHKQNYIHTCEFSTGCSGERVEGWINNTFSEFFHWVWMCEASVNKFFWLGVRIKSFQSSRYLWYQVLLN